MRIHAYFNFKKWENFKRLFIWGLGVFKAQIIFVWFQNMSILNPQYDPPTPLKGFGWFWRVSGASLCVT